MRFIFIIVTFYLLVITSCSEENNDCICTTEYRLIMVIVVDDSNNLVSGLITTVKDDSGKVYDVYNDPHIFPGHYTVMDDKFAKELSPQPKRFIFTGVKDSLTVDGEFFVNTDDCICHVQKVSGPDTLVLN